MELFGQQGGPELDDALDVGSAGVPFRVRYPGGHDDCIAGPGQVLLAVEGEMGFASSDGEALLLVRVDMFGYGQLDDRGAVTDRSMRLASGPVGRRPVPAVTRTP